MARLKKEVEDISRGGPAALERDRASAGTGSASSLCSSFEDFMSQWTSARHREKRCAADKQDGGKIIFAVASTLQQPRGRGSFAPWRSQGFQVVSRARIPVIKVDSKVFIVSALM